MRRGARHRPRGFATVEPASDAFLPLRCSRTEKLDPTRLHRLITCGHEDHAPLVDFCNRWRFASTTCAIDQTLYSQAVLPLSEHNQPRFHRPEAGAANAVANILPPRSLAAEACPQPDRLGHLIVASSFQQRLETPLPRDNPVGLPPSPPGGLRFHVHANRAASHPLPRRRACSAAPKVPSINKLSLKGSRSFYTARRYQRLVREPAPFFRSSQ